MLAQWTQAAGYGVICCEGVPDFRTQQRDIAAPFPDAVRMLVSGYGSSITNLYCPPSTRYPSTAYTVDARIDEQARLIFVYGIPTNHECRPMPG